ncbi:MAG: GNAT family N-acetyltransferase [Sedimentisphaerales bacterium]|nr:GNAT family N-acetyltransferase [Sedimentisphaerales bacterium]
MNETQGQIEFKDLQVEYTEQVAALHIQCISTGFISSMGIDFVTNLYEAIVQSNSSFGVVAVRNKKVLGFATFTTNINTLYKAIIWRKGLKFALLLAGHICSLKQVKKIFETLFYPTRIKNKDFPSAELLSIAVAPEEQRKGLAGQLIEMGFRHYRETGADKVKVLIGADNKAGNELYLKCGFEFAEQIINHGLPSNIYVAQINHV